MKSKRITKRAKTVHPIRLVTRDEEIRIIDLLQSKGSQDSCKYYSDVADLIEVLADTGMRLGEVLSLRSDDLNFDKRMIYIAVTKHGVFRRVPMTTRVLIVLKRRLSEHHNKIFILAPHQIHIAWSWVAEQITINGVDRPTLYSLRKTCAQRLLDAGVQPSIMNAMIGIISVQQERRLALIPDKKLLQAAELLELATQN